MAKESSQSFEVGKKKLSIKTMVVVILIGLVFIPLTVYAIKYVTELRSRAEVTAKPENIEITNVSGGSASISWLTPGVETTGYVKYGTTEEVSSTASDVRATESGEKYDLHYVDLKNLSPNTKYYYVIVNGGKEYKNNGSPYTFKTGPVLDTLMTPQPIKGTAQDPSGGDEEVMVVLYVKNNGSSSNKLSTLTNNLTYTFDLSNLRKGDLSESFNNLNGATLYLIANGGQRGEGTVKTEILQL